MHHNACKYVKDQFVYCAFICFRPSFNKFKCERKLECKCVGKHRCMHIYKHVRLNNMHIVHRVLQCVCKHAFRYDCKEYTNLSEIYLYIYI